MLDLSHLVPNTGNAIVQTFIGTSLASGNDWQVWNKPRGKTMIDILLVGKGGNGGAGVIGGVSTAAGGGGGGSGTQTRVTMPLALLPDQLILSLAGITNTNNVQSYIWFTGASGVANHVVAHAAAGGNGGNASGATAGAAGVAGVTTNAAAMPIGWMFATVIAGQSGIIGGTTGASTGLTIPQTGLLVTGGTGGAGLGASGSTGSTAGGITGIGALPTIAGSVGGSSATTPPQVGSSGFQPLAKTLLLYGGTGGGSTHGSATTTGLVQASGGNGAPGCGGGGSGGALTGSTAGTVGLGGPAFCIITCW